MPPSPSATVRPLALMSPALKLIVEVDGVAVGSGPTKTAHELVSLTTVTLPVTAVAPTGAYALPMIWKETGVLAGNLPEKPLATRVSSRRDGGRGTNLEPVASAV